MAEATPTLAQKGHPIGFWFIFFGEFAERCSYYGMRAILALYMRDVLNFKEANASLTVTLFMASCYFLPLLGGYIADNYFGKYLTIVGFSLPYVVGQYLVGIENKYVVFGALALLAMGSGVIKPNISSLMGMTYDQFRPGQEQLRSRAFSWFYMAINIGAGLAQLAMPALRDKYGYQTAFLFPAFFMAAALFIFALGKRYYAVEVIDRKVLSPEDAKADWALKQKTISQIGGLFFLVMFFWAIFDQAATTWIFFADVYMDTTIVGERIDGSSLLVSGDALFDFTEPIAKYISPIGELCGYGALSGVRGFGPTADAIQAANPWFIVVFVPISVWFFSLMQRRGTTIRATDKMIVGFVLTGLSMVIMALAGFQSGASQTAARITMPSGQVFLPFTLGSLEEVKAGQESLFGTARFVAADWTFDEEKSVGTFQNGSIELGDGNRLIIDKGHIHLTKSKGIVGEGKVAVPGALEVIMTPGEYTRGGGTAIVGATNKGGIKGTSGPQPDSPEGKVTVKAVKWSKPAERVTVWWQILAYLIITFAEILISVTGLELAFTAAPPTMKSFVTGMWLFTVGMANLVVNVPFVLLYPLMPPGIYFAILAATMAVVTVGFVYMAKRFNRATAADAPAA